MFKIAEAIEIQYVPKYRSLQEKTEKVRYFVAMLQLCTITAKAFAMQIIAYYIQSYLHEMQARRQKKISGGHSRFRGAHL